MRAQSEIIEINKELYDIEVADEYQTDSDLHCDKLQYNEQGVSIERDMLYCGGLHIMELRLNTTRPLTNPWVTEKPHIRFFFYLKGNSSVQNGAGNANYRHSVGTFQRNFLDTEGGGGTVLLHENGTMHYIVIKMTLDFYIHLVKSEPWIADDAFHRYVLSKKPKNQPNETLYMDQNMLHIIQEIMQCENIVKHRYHFIKLKLRELLFDIHQQTNLSNPPQVIDISTEMMLDLVKDYLVQHMDNPPTSVELAKIFLLNEKKFKQDFKQKFGMTIYTFVVQARMERAKELLLTDHNVNEIATLIGYNSVSHFIKVFKNYYGCTPKEALIQFQDNFQVS
jgi:AraC-like DNA-binding protein